ncbi:phosphotransferase family protein [Mycobacterium conspicuum]|uniref:Uncharacterized protein n=1 Tax=Mycobacterium conspicuum TaxID=44010 RepID=A0A1X1TMV0_9MYCO|nr:phosphotransferase family protein [Mycobacterium conspicuum]ORV45902.1 hypothetical protein AWC00_05580 [Mycobacterium conspicuum]BBZ38839.1 hypothetical protein MCNS_19020 [Mycobacterium conspicuum]
MALPDSAVQWVEQRCGGRVVDVEQQVRWRPHHFLKIERPEGTIEVLVRSERQGLAAGSTFQQHFDIAHEARVLKALQGQGIKVPEFLGFNDEHRFILMERVEGTNELKDAPDDETRERVMTEYIEQLAALHRLDVDSMTLSGLKIPVTPEERAFGGKFGYVEQDFAGWKQYLKPEPLLELGIWWLHANVPPGDRYVSFVQGDTGPGQFMFADGHLTALIDWELSHIGDPMLDLGVIRMRNMLYPTGPLRKPIAHYEEISGRPIDWQALGFYTVVSMLLTPIGLSTIMQRPSAHIEPVFPGFGWNATLRRGLTDALAEAIGLDVEPPELPEAPASEWPQLIDYLVEYLEVKCAPIETDEAGRFEISAATSIALSVQLESRVGAALLDADLSDMAKVLGRRPDDRDDGYAKLAELVAAGPAERLEELVWLFARTERRREYLHKPMMIAQDSGDFERLAPRKADR